MRAARPPAPAQLAEAYRDIPSLVLTIDGLPPEKGHEPLDVVRELRRKRVWCAEPWLSRAPPEIRRLSVVARRWAERLDQPVRGWRAEKQDAFVKAIARECPGTPHRYGSNHCLRDVAHPVLEMDSRAQGKRRRPGRGRRALARRVREDHRPAAAPAPTPPDERSKTAAAAPWAASARGLPATESALEAPGGATTGEARVADEGGEVGLGYCAAVRGMLPDSQGGPLHPPGVRRRAAFQEGRDALERHLQAKKGGVQRRWGNAWPVAWTADALSHGMPWRQLVSTPKPGKQWMVSWGRAPRPRGPSVRRGASRCSRSGSPARLPLRSILPRGCAALHQGGLWEARRLSFRPTIGPWSGGAKGPTATNAGAMGIATLACGSYGKGQR
jgi:hypothetical protein